MLIKKNKIFIIIKNTLFIKKLFFFLDKSKLYIYNSYLVDDYRPENKNDKTIFTHLEEQVISEIAMKSALKSNLKLVNYIKKNILFHNLIKKYSDKRIIIAANKLLFFQHYDQCRLSIIKKKLKENKKFFFIFEKKEDFILYNLFKTIFLIFKFLLQNINYESLFFKKKKLFSYDYAFHINNPKEVLKNDEENKIYFKKNKKILLLESQWGLFSPEIKKKIKKNNLDYANDQKINITLSQLFYKVIPEFYYLLTLIFKQIIKLNMDKFFLAYVRVRLDILRLIIFFENYKIKNFISRDDFSSTHILRTIILENKNCKHIGISHSNFLDPLTSIQNHFKCHSKYLVSSLLIKKLYESTWSNSKTINIGQFQAGKIIKHRKDNTLKKTIYKKFGKKKKIILLLLSSINSSNTFNSFEENKKNLTNILNVLNFDKNYVLVIKPRSRHRALEFISSLTNYKKFKKRIFIVFDEFSTYELVSHSKFLFAPAASSSIFEGMYNKKLVILPINTNSIKNLVWSKFPKIRIFKNSNEVIEFFINIKKKNYIENYKKSFKPIEKIMCNNKKNPIDLIINNL